MEERGWADYRLAKEANLLAQFFAEGHDSSELPEEQRILFAKWSTLTDEQRRLLLDLMNTM